MICVVLKKKRREEVGGMSELALGCFIFPPLWTKFNWSIICICKLNVCHTFTSSLVLSCKAINNYNCAPLCTLSLVAERVQ